MERKFIDMLDPELRDMVEYIPEGEIATRENIMAIRETTNAVMDSMLSNIPISENLTIEKKIIKGLSGEPDVEIAIYQPKDMPEDLMPGIINIHGGGLNTCCADHERPTSSLLADQYKCTVVCPEYRLAPENEYPAALNDCYAALVWFAEHAEELHVDPKKICVSGNSAGACLAAAIAIKARDDNGPAIMGQLLSYAMLDYRNITPSSKAFNDHRVWSRDANIAAWDMYLGKDHEEPVPATASPAMLCNYEDLPPAFIIVGTCDVFRDENIAYAQNLMQAGVDVELHVLPGMFHGGESYLPDAEISEYLSGLRSDAIGRFLEKGYF